MKRIRRRIKKKMLKRMKMERNKTRLTLPVRILNLNYFWSLDDDEVVIGSEIEEYDKTSDE